MGMGMGKSLGRAQALYHRCKAVAGAERSRGSVACSLAGALVSIRRHWWVATSEQSESAGGTAAAPANKQDTSLGASLRQWWSGSLAAGAMAEALELVTALAQYFVHVYTLPD